MIGSISSSNPGFSPKSIPASANATNVTAYVLVQLSGGTVATGSVPLQLLDEGEQWQGTAVLNGVTVQLNISWDDAQHGSGSYHARIYPPRGSGPLYNALPALLDLELILGTGTGEHPAGGMTEIGGPANPWTQQTGSSRVRWP